MVNHRNYVIKKISFLFETIPFVKKIPSYKNMKVELIRISDDV